MKNLMLIYLLVLVGIAFSGCEYFKGPQGDPGQVGLEGASCVVNQLSNGAEIVCGGVTKAVILNGTNGSDGSNGLNGNDGANGRDGTNGTNGVDGLNAPTIPYTVVAIIDPCGKQSAYDEVLLKLENGNILAHYSDGNKEFLTFVGPGSYRTTDGTSCAFTVFPDMTVYW
jgi:hypothetical protein